MKVILHIGVEKTGTTSIQNFLAINFAALRSHNIFFYGGRLLPNKRQSTELVLASVEKPGSNFAKLRNTGISDFRKRVRSEIKSVIDFAEKNGVTQLLFSSEHMSSRMRAIEEVEVLRSLFPKNLSFEIVVYCRRQDELYLGTLAEGIKAGTVIQEPLDKEIQLGDGFYSRNYYDYNKLLSMWSEIFGKQNIKVYTFEKSRLKSKDVVADFLSKALLIEDLSNWRIPENHYSNRRLSAEFLYFLSNFNRSCSVADRTILLQNVGILDTFTSNSFIPVSRLAEFLNSFNDSNNLAAQNFLDRRFMFNQSTISRKDYVVANDQSLSISMKSISDQLDRIQLWND